MVEFYHKIIYLTPFSIKFVLSKIEITISGPSTFIFEAKRVHWSQWIYCQLGILCMALQTQLKRKYRIRGAFIPALCIVVDLLISLHITLYSRPRFDGLILQRLSELVVSILHNTVQCLHSLQLSLILKYCTLRTLRQTSSGLIYFYPTIFLLSPFLNSYILFSIMILRLRLLEEHNLVIFERSRQIFSFHFFRIVIFLICIIY